MKASSTLPIKSATPDTNGTLTDYSTMGSKSFFTPSFGLGVHEYASRNFRFEANVSGFGLPGHWYLVDGDAAIAYRADKSNCAPVASPSPSAPLQVPTTFTAARKPASSSDSAGTRTRHRGACELRPATALPAPVDDSD